MHVFSTLPFYPANAPVRRLNEQFSYHRQVLNIARPLEWGGTMRRQDLGYARTGEAERYARAFPILIAEATTPGWTIGIDTIRHVHDKCVGGTQFRRTGLRVGVHGEHAFPKPTKIDTLVEEFVVELNSRDAEPLTTAASIHLRLLDIHAFADGNGRTSRMLSSMWLAHHGCHSLLLMGVEQHFNFLPHAYIRYLDAYRFGQISKQQCETYVMRSMLMGSTYGCWMKARRDVLRQLLRTRAFDCARFWSEVNEWDRGRPGFRARKIGDKLLSLGLAPLAQLTARLPREQLLEFARQTRILKLEQTIDHNK